MTDPYRPGLSGDNPRDRGGVVGNRTRPKPKKKKLNQVPSGVDRVEETRQRPQPRSRPKRGAVGSRAPEFNAFDVDPIIKASERRAKKAGTHFSWADQITRPTRGLLETFLGEDVARVATRSNPWLLPPSAFDDRKPIEGSGLALEAALFAPVFRGPRAGYRAAKALKAGEGVGHSVRAGESSLHEAGPITKAARAVSERARRATRTGPRTNEDLTKLAGEDLPPTTPPPISKTAQRGEKESYRARTVVYKELEQQFPKSPSRMTAQGQRLWDRATEHLANKTDVLREGGTVSRAAGRAITPLSARARVPKQAGKMVRQEGKRRQALRAEDIRRVKTVGRTFPGVKNEGAQLAHFWWAQMPEGWRGATGGLGRVRAQLQAEHDAVSGHTIDELKTIAEEIKKLDKVIANPPKFDAGVVDSLRTLMDDRKDILVRAGKLDPERAAEREGLISNWLGVKPTGEEVYLGHRASKVRGSRSSGLPGNVSTGKTRLPEGVATQNRLRLAKTGRVRQDLMSAIEDWQSAQAYEFHNIAKDELSRMGSPLTATFRPGPDDVVINPKGHTLPRHWKADKEELAVAEGFDPDDVLIRDVEEYLRNYMAEGADADRLIRAAVDAGHLDDLRVVPRDVVRRYYSQFLPTKIHAATPGAREGANVIAKGADIANDALYASLIFSNPGYIPANTLANLVMGVAQQGAFLPANLARSAQIMTSGPKRVRDLLKGEVGVGPTGAIVSETSPIRHLGHIVSEVADTPHRIAAFIHEAARAGVISSKKPHLSKADYEALEALLTNPAHRPLLNDVRDRAVQAMIDFERAGSMERALGKRLLFVWSFLRGATRYPARFALDHPVRTAAGAAVAYDQQDDIRDRFQGGMPSYLQGAINTGEAEVGGKTFPQVLPTRNFSPLSTPWEMYGAAIGRPGANTAYEFLNPGLRSLLQIGNRQDARGDTVSYREAIQSQGERLVPQARLVGDLLNPEGGGLYPEDVTRSGRLKRASRVFPIAIDPNAAAEARERESQETITLPKKAKGKTPDQEADAWIKKTEKAVGPLPQELKDARRAKALYEGVQEDLRDQLGVDKLTPKQRAALKLAILLDRHPEYGTAADDFKSFLKDADAEGVNQFDNWLDKKLFWNELNKWSSRRGKLERANASR